MPLKDLYAKLMSIGNIVLILVLPLQPFFHVWYKPDLTCEYYSGKAMVLKLVMLSRKGC